MNPKSIFGIFGNLKAVPAVPIEYEDEQEALPQPDRIVDRAVEMVANFI